MHFNLVQMITLAGEMGIPNDDRIGLASTHAWVIDGATDLGEPGLLGERGGAAWLAATADSAFHDAAGPLPALCETVFATIGAHYAAACRRAPIAEWELPTASFAAVAVQNGRLDCVFSGDCAVLHRTASGTAFLTRAPDRTSESGDAAALGVGTGGLTLKSHAVLADRRASRARERDALTIDPIRSQAATTAREIVCDRGDSILLMSDGFSSLIDAYRAYTAEGLVRAVEELGLAAVAMELREIERRDLECTRHPRFKASDDASAMWITVG